MFLTFTLDYIKHFWNANTRHGTHSPFVYKLLDEVIYDYSPKKVYVGIEMQREMLLRDDREISILDLGAGSTVRPASRLRPVKDIAKHSLKKPKLAQLLYRVVHSHNSTLEAKSRRDLVGADLAGEAFTVLELGTCLGLTTAYLACAASASQVYTIEGCPNTAAVAMENWGALAKSGVLPADYTSLIKLRIGNFDAVLPELASDLKRLDVLYIDGNHTKEATLRYFHWALERVHEDSLLIFDDIYWSEGMKAAWEEIKAHPEVTVTIDFFWIGLVYFRKGQAKEHFKIRL